MCRRNELVFGPCHCFFFNSASASLEKNSFSCDLKSGTGIAKRRCPTMTGDKNSSRDATPMTRLNVPRTMPCRAQTSFTKGQRLRDAAEAALKSSGYQAVARLGCEVLDGGVVFLSGVVSSFYHKQVAQAVVLRLDAVNRVENRVEVVH